MALDPNRQVEHGSKLVSITRRHYGMPAGEAFAEGPHPDLTLGECSSQRRRTGLWLPGYLRLGPLYKAMSDFTYPVASPLRLLNLKTCRPV